MTTSNEKPVVLTVRGTHKQASLEAARILHNQTAGSERGIAAARALGDLSHKVYAPCARAAALSGAKEGEIAFIDVWEDPKGIMDFFSNPQVQESAGHLFASREASVWMPAQGSFSFHLPAPMGHDERSVGMIRGPIQSPEAAIEAFRVAGTKGLRDARRRGQLSHDIFIRIPPPGDRSPVELLGIDVWANTTGMLEQYADTMKMGGLAAVFTATPQASVWEPPPGSWSEW
jgi:hypothetical protein